jgi:hypothetical protein
MGTAFQTDSGIAAGFLQPLQGCFAMSGPIPGVAASRQPQAICRDAVGVVPTECDHPRNGVRIIPAKRDTDDSLGLGRQPLPQDSVDVPRTPSGVPEASRAVNPTRYAQAPIPGKLFSKEDT